MRPVVCTANSGSCVKEGSLYNHTSNVNSFHEKYPIDSREEKILNGLWCWYCDCETAEVTGLEVYPAYPELREKLFYRCVLNSDHYVGRFSHNGQSFGIVADEHLRKLKMKGHSLFDPLWKPGPNRLFRTRREAYLWLSKAMGIPPEHTHFGMFRPDLCLLAIEFCLKAYK